MTHLLQNETDLQKQVISYLCDEVHQERIKWACIQNTPDCVIFGEYGSASKTPGKRFVLFVKPTDHFVDEEQRNFLERMRADDMTAHTVWSLHDAKNVLFCEINVHEIENEREETNHD